MMKKIISFAVALCMILSMLASFFVVASADEALTVVYKNADTDEIQIYFNDTVETTALTGNVTLSKNGQNVTISKLASEALPTTPSKQSGATLTTPCNMVKIQPQGGLELDTIYTLKIKAGVATSDSGKVLASDFVWVFKVTELFSDDFEDGSKARWENVLGTANGDEAFSVIDDGINGKSLQLAPVGGGAYFMPKAANLPYTSSNYTVKYKRRTSTADTKIFFYTNNQFSWDQTPSYALRFERQSWAVNDVYLRTNSDIDLSEYRVGETELMKVSSKDGMIMIYDHNPTWGMLRNYVATSADTANVVNQGSIAFFVPKDGTALIDDILVTQVVHISDAELEDLNVAYKNADTDEIQIYFDDTVNTSELTGNVTLYKKGQEVTISKLLSEAMPSTPTKVSGTTLQAPENMIKIQPQGGLELDAVYSLKINSGISGTNGKVLSDDFVWNFKVTELFSDDFEDGSKEGWENALGTANGDEAFSVVDNGLNGKSLQLAPVGGGAYFMPKAANLPYTSSNYTVKYRHSSSTTGVETYFYTNDQHGYGKTPSYALRFTRQNWAANNVYLYSNSGVDLSAYQIGDPELMKVSSKDGTIMVYTNDDTWGLLRSYVATSADTANVVNQGSIAFFVPKDGTALIDDILVTQAVDITDIYATDMELTLKNAEGGAVTTLTEATKASASMYILNCEDAEMDIVVVYALYKGDNEFVTAHKCETLSLDANTGASFDLPETATNGATKIKVFIWNNLTDLTPYDICQQFPAN